MGRRIRRYYSAIRRLQKSHGYGIHSPFAFKFVLNVLRERLPYYNYEQIEEVRKTILSGVGRYSRHSRIMSKKNGKMVFRVVNYFNPRNILQVGTNYGMSTVCMLQVSSASQLCLCEHNLNAFPVTAQVLEPYRNRISLHDPLEQAIACYKRRLAQDEKPFVLVNSVEEQEYDTMLAYINEILASQGVIILRNLTRYATMARLHDAIAERYTYGMIFTNDKISFVVSNPKLPRQRIALWF